MGPADKFGAAIERDGLSCQVGQIAHSFHDLTHDGLRTFVRVLQQHGEPADALDERCDVRLAKLLFEQYQICLPMAKLASMSDIIRAKQNTDITVKFWPLTLSGATWPTRLSVFRQVPPELLRHAFLRVDILVDGFLADAQLGAFMDHPVADLFRPPSLFDLGHDAPAQIRMSYELALYGSAFLRLQLCSVSKVSGVVLGQGFIRPKIPFDLSKNRNSQAPARGLSVGFGVSPICHRTHEVFVLV
jgi:hypothetical protein